jgi:hypothetical protein
MALKRHCNSYGPGLSGAAFVISSFDILFLFPAHIYLSNNDEKRTICVSSSLPISMQRQSVWCVFLARTSHSLAEPSTMRRCLEEFILHKELYRGKASDALRLRNELHFSRLCSRSRSARSSIWPPVDNPASKSPSRYTVRGSSALSVG